jgi:aryl-alcohol dehydrogenase-like predicted oxidoreductase
VEFVTINRAEIEVSRIALGTWAIGGVMWGGSNEKESIDTVHAALDAGINLIDTAPVYGFGRAEEIVGKAVKTYGSRDKICISTKAGLEWKGGKVFRNSQPVRLALEVEDSLRRLQTDYIDIYFVHWPDQRVPIEETARLMQAVLDQGKVRAIGVSNYDVEQMKAFRTVAELHLCQPPYNIFEREIEKGIIPFCRSNKITLITYGALCRGLLSGRMSRNRDFHGDDLRKIDPKFQEPRFSQYLKAVERIERLARNMYGKELLATAVRWILDQDVDIALWGGRRPDQMQPAREVFGWSIEAEFTERVKKIISETITEPEGPEFMTPPPGDDHPDSNLSGSAKDDLEKVL